MKLFSKNARVCFIGDSITEGNWFVAHIAAHYKEKHPELNVNFYNCGISGGWLRVHFINFETDIMSYNPTDAVIMMGINDSGRDLLKNPPSEKRYEELKRHYEDYKINLKKLCDMLKSRGVNVILCTPMPYAEYQNSEVETLRGGFALIQGYAEFVRSFAEKQKIDCCDYHSYAVKIMQSEDIIYPDRVHPLPRGHYYMAKRFLEFQGEDLGDEKPLPEYMNMWLEQTGKLRNIFATEWMIIKMFDSSDDEKIAFIKKYLENKEYAVWGEQLGEHFKIRAERYLNDKKNQSQIQKTVQHIMEVEFKK